MGKIRAIVKRADEQFGHVTWIGNSLKNLQTQVGGYIECVTDPAGRFVILCDEEGRLKDKPYNCTVDFGPHRHPVSFVGDIIAVGVGEEDFVDLPEEISLKAWKEMIK